MRSETDPPWIRHPQPWTDVTGAKGAKGAHVDIQPPTGVHCRTCCCAPCLKKRQTTRMCKVICEQCGCVIRMTRTWMMQAGLPTCGCRGRMVAEIPPGLAIEEGVRPVVSGTRRGLKIRKNRIRARQLDGLE